MIKKTNISLELKNYLTILNKLDHKSDFHFVGISLLSKYEQVLKNNDDKMILFKAFLSIGIFLINF